MRSFKIKERKENWEQVQRFPSIWSRTNEGSAHNSHLSIFSTCARAHRHTCVHAVFQYEAGLRHAVRQCQGFCRFSDISHTSRKMSDPGTKHAARGSELQRGRKAEVSRPAGPRGDLRGWQWNGLLTWQMPACEKYFFSPVFFFTRVGKLCAGCASTHPERSERKHQTHCRFLVGSSFLWLPLDSRKGTVTCADLAGWHLQRGVGLINTLTQNYWVLKVVYANMHLTHMADITDMSVACGGPHNTETGSRTFMSLLPSWQVSILIGPADPVVSCLLHSPWNRHDIVLI